MDSRLFFTLVIPAHNESGYIERTLERILALEYPKDRHEIFVVENGSSDDTFQKAKRFERENLRVLQSEKGVSKAKNLGVDSARKDSDWIIFVDADTVLEKEFLLDLDAFLREPRHNYTVGTFSVRPLPSTLNARLWFALYDLGHRFTHTSYSIKAVKRSLFPPVRFDESLVTAEDLHVIAQARAFGKFFFMSTNTVLTSTRRFEKVGWWKLFFIWTFVAVLPENWQQRFAYEVIR